MAPSEQTTQPAHHTSSREVLQEERYLWMSRAFVVMVVLAFICDMILLIALANVTPVLRVQPFYIETKDKNEQIIDIVRPSAETLNSDVLKESFVRQYLLARYSIGSDFDEQEARWGENGTVRWMSEDTVYTEFTKLEAIPLMERARKENTTRSVSILRVNKIRKSVSGEGDTYEATLELRTINRASSQPEVKKYVAIMQVAFRPSERTRLWSQRLKNPLGFTVLHFGLNAGEG